MASKREARSAVRYAAAKNAGPLLVHPNNHLWNLCVGALFSGESVGEYSASLERMVERCLGKPKKVKR